MDSIGTGAYHVSVRVWVPQRYEVVVTLPADATWTATRPMVTVNAAKRWVGLGATATAGRPDIVRAHLYTSTAGVPGQVVRLWVRFGTTSAWTLVASRTTDTNGWTYLGVQPRRLASYYWSYAGSPAFVATHSPVVAVAY